MFVQSCLIDGNINAILQANSSFEDSFNTAQPRQLDTLLPSLVAVLAKLSGSLSGSDALSPGGSKALPIEEGSTAFDVPTLLLRLEQMLRERSESGSPGPRPSEGEDTTKNYSPDKSKRNEGEASVVADSKTVSTEPECTDSAPDGQGKQIDFLSDERYKKYVTMLRAGLPSEVVAAKLGLEGLDPSAIQILVRLATMAPESSLTDKSPPLPSPAPKENVVADKTEENLAMVAVQDHPVYSKYFKMLKVGLPKGAVKNKMIQEGVDPTILDKDPCELISRDEKTEDSTPMVAVQDHPVYSKYFKMLKVGLPKDAVKNKMIQEGVDPTILDKDPSDKVPVDGPPKVSPPKIQIVKKSKVRKKKLHWKALDASKVSGDCLWLDKDDEDEDIRLDEVEFRKLFEDRLVSFDLLTSKYSNRPPF